jgi:hypothetical protein
MRLPEQLCVVVRLLCPIRSFNTRLGIPALANKVDVVVYPGSLVQGSVEAAHRCCGPATLLKPIMSEAEPRDSNSSLPPSEPPKVANSSGRASSWMSAAAQKVRYQGDLSELRVSTIHGMCNQILTQHRHRTDLGNSYETLSNRFAELYPSVREYVRTKQVAPNVYAAVQQTPTRDA